MEFSIKLRDLIDRPIIRNDQVVEFLNKMTDAEINRYNDELDAILAEEGVTKNYPSWNSASLSKMIDRDVLYNLFKEVDLIAKGNFSEKDLHIRLVRTDLIKRKKDICVDEITLYDFKLSSLSREQMNKATSITFFNEDGKIKELKNKYASWPLNK